MSAESTPGKGTTLTITMALPIDNEERDFPSLSSSLKGLRILVVDGHKKRLNLLTEKLQALGTNALNADSADSAMGLLKQAYASGKPFEVVIIDNHVPPMGGEMLGRAINASKDLKETALILVTGSGQRGDANRATEAGFSGYMVTPISEAKLIQAISAVWNAKQSGIQVGLITRHRIAEYNASETKENASADPASFNLHILLAEDNEINQMMAKRVFEKLGCTVSIASDGEEVLESYKADSSVDLIFMDCLMPIMDGYEATHELRKLEETSGRHIPIIAMTANVMKGDKEKCLESGMDDYVSKPVRQTKIEEVLNKWQETIKSSKET